MKTTITIISLLMSVVCQAQLSFQQVPPPLPSAQNINEFSGLGNGEIVPFDYDNDGDLDVFLTTNTNPFGIAKLYTNDGLGNFIENKNVHFDYVDQASADVADVDGDNDLDILITGEDSLNNPSAKLYLNNCGTFQKVLGTPFVGAYNGNVAFADVDMDNDLDVLISGSTGFTLEPVKLYKNDGNGNFVYVSGTPMVPSSWGSIEFADIDGDLDPDLLITGESGVAGVVTKLYENDGLGNFSLIASPMPGIRNSATEFADVDNDNDLDLLIHGWRMVFTTTVYETDLYKNDGNGVFTITSTPFTQVGSGNVAFSDVDNDNDLDILVAGNAGTLQSLKMYRNDGLGNYTYTINENFPWWSSHAMDLFDIDGDNDDDLVTVGTRIIDFIHVNDGTGTFSGASGSAFYAIESGTSEMADVDGDNDLDILMHGIKDVGGNLGYYTGFYLNDGTGGYTDSPSLPFDQMRQGDIEFADVDGDLDLDVFVTGYSTPSSGVTKLYINDGLGIYTELAGTPFTGLGQSSMGVADVDGDSDLDLMIIGFASGSVATTQLFLNDGFGVFTEDLTNTFPQLYWGSINFVDIDNDSDMDLVLTGKSAVWTSNYTNLYTNDGTGVFTEVLSTPFTGIYNSAVDVADVDGDNDMDIIMTGKTNGGYLTELYINNGTGNYSVLPTAIDLIYEGAVKFADMDNDNDMDIVISGNSSANVRAEIYLNDGAANFTAITNNTHFYPSFDGSISIGDVNGDNLKDVFFSGTGDEYKFARLYKQIACETESASVSYSGCGNFVSGSGAIYSSSGTYVEVIPNASTCDSIITYCVVITGANSAASITETSCGSYTAPSGAVFNSTGIYQDIITNAAGCDSVITIDLTTVIDNSITQSWSILTSNDSNAAYQWIDCSNNSIIAGETNQSLNVTVDGSYAVVLNLNGCSDTSDCIVINNAGVNEAVIEFEVSIYPNPSSGGFSIEHNLNEPKLRVMNVFGSVVYQKDSCEMKEQVELNVAKGVYYTELVSGDIVVIKKVLIY